jgi:hypothetical protein
MDGSSASDIPAFRQHATILYVISQKKVLFIVTDVRISNSATLAS